MRWTAIPLIFAFGLLLFGCTTVSNESNSSVNVSTNVSTNPSTNQSTGQYCKTLLKGNVATLDEMVNDENLTLDGCYVDHAYSRSKEDFMQTCYWIIAKDFFYPGWSPGASPSVGFNTYSSPHWGKAVGENMNYYYVDYGLTKETKNIDAQGTIIEHYSSYVITHQVVNPIMENGRLVRVELVEFDCQQLPDVNQ